MSAPSQLHDLLSPQWYRVAGLCPRLRSGVKVSRQLVRGESWYVLSDPLTGHHHRFSAAAYALVSGCDGQRRIDDIWSALVDDLGDDAPSQTEAIAVFGQAYGANLLTGETPKDARAAMNMRQRQRRKERAAAVHPLSFKVPLGNPDAKLRRLDPLAAILFGPAGWWLAGLVAVVGAFVMAWNAGDLQQSLRQRWGDANLLWALWLAYPAVKLVHELAHAMAVRAYGGRVPEIGVQLLLLTPAPYVDASASSAFPAARHRIAVAAAGVAAEWALATVAVVAWVVLEPGWWRDIALSVSLIGGLSTLLVNGNPLVRFDGYHVLCDALELPNLAPRSARWWRERAQAWLTGMALPQRLVPARGEAKWLAFYAPAAWVYRLTLLLGLSLLAAQWQPIAGLLALGYAVWACALGPAMRALAWLADADVLHRRRGRAVGLALAGIGALSLLLFIVPVPRVTHAAGVVVLPDEALVRPEVDGFVTAIAARDGQTVAPGEVLLQLGNEPLRLEADEARRKADEAALESHAAFGSDPLRWALARDRATALEADAQRLAVKVEALTLRASVAGRLVIDPRRVVPGVHVGQGEVVAQVLPEGAAQVRALLPGSAIAELREPGLKASVALASQAAQAHDARIERSSPQASHELPSSALGQAQGGPFALDAVDRSGRTAAKPRFAIDLRLPPGVDARVGMRALVSFDLGRAPVATQLAHGVRRALLRHFDQ